MHRKSSEEVGEASWISVWRASQPELTRCIMALTVNTNMSALRAANTLNNTQGALSQTLARVSSGMRITSAADDAAGSAVATNLATQARSGRQAIRNANDGISVIQTAESASKEVLSILDRMRELAVQSSSETLEDGERAYIDSEFDQLSAEVERIAQSSEFNGISLSSGGTSQLAVQVGVSASSNSRVTISLGDLTASNLGVDTATGVDFSCGIGCAVRDHDHRQCHRLGQQHPCILRCNSEPA